MDKKQQEYQQIEDILGWEFSQWIIRGIEEDIGEKYTKDSCIVCESIPMQETYLTDNLDFFFDEYHKGINAGEPIELIKTHITTIDELSEKENLCRLLEVNKEKKYQKSVYQRCQYYGGAEEGGWYYHNMILTDYSPDSVETGTDRYGEGYIVQSEFYAGEHENLRKPHYC